MCGHSQVVSAGTQRGSKCGDIARQSVWGHSEAVRARTKQSMQAHCRAVSAGTQQGNQCGNIAKQSVPEHSKAISAGT